jgi:YD repeat-containing protein
MPASLSRPPLGNGPDGVYKRTEHTCNRQGEVVTTKDPNESRRLADAEIDSAERNPKGKPAERRRVSQTVHTYDRDKLGRLLHDRITAFGTGIDQTVKRISITYEVKRLLTAKVGSYSHATPGSGSILNEVSYAYDGLGQMTKDRQSHSGAVVPGTTPEVSYAYATP